MDTEGECYCLVVEDSDGKYTEIRDVLLNTLPSRCHVIRAATIMEAEQLICVHNWKIVILDVSMNITQSRSGAKQGGHDTIGGLKIARKMFLLRREAPTVIVTAFDSFPSGEIQRNRREILGLEDVQARALEILQDAFVGCVRYGSADWKNELRDFVTASVQG